MTTHSRWGHWPIKGAYGPTGGHVKLPGFIYAWTDSGPYWEFQLFGWFAVKREYGHTRWGVGCITLKFTQARWRYSEREHAALRRRARRRIAHT